MIINEYAIVLRLLFSTFIYIPIPFRKLIVVSAIATIMANTAIINNIFLVFMKSVSSLYLNGYNGHI